MHLSECLRLRLNCEVQLRLRLMVSLNAYFSGNASKKHAKPSDIQNKSIILQKEYTSLKSKELEGLPRFQVMIWQLSQLT